MGQATVVLLTLLLGVVAEFILKITCCKSRHLKKVILVIK